MNIALSYNTNLKNLIDIIRELRNMSNVKMACCLTIMYRSINFCFLSIDYNFLVETYDNLTQYSMNYDNFELPFVQFSSDIESEAEFIPFIQLKTTQKVIQIIHPTKN